MKEIQLTQKKVALVDDEDYERLNQHKWFAHKDYTVNLWYAIRNSPYIGGKRKQIRMHREIMGIFDEYIEVDHKNSDGLFNCKKNLRLATHQQNMCNRKFPYKNNKLGMKGVRLLPRSKKFNARITINGKLIHLGSFHVLGDADSAYRVAEEKYFCELARGI